MRLYAGHRHGHATMVTLTLLCLARFIPYLAVAAGFIGFALVVIWFIFPLYRR